MSLTLTKSKEPKRLFFRHIIRKVFLEDWGLKLFALVITVGLWFGVTGLSTPFSKRFQSVPLNFSISNNSEIINAPPQEVEIEVLGDKRKVEQINKNDLVATLDLTEVLPGEYSVSLLPGDNISVSQLPLGVKLVLVQPSRIPVNLEAVEEKDVEVKVNADGEPAAGYEIYTSNAVPPRIRVRGPASFMKKLDFVETDKIDLTGKNGEFTAKQIPVTVSNPKAAVLNTVVDVYFRIGEKRVERSFSIPVFGLPGKTASITIYGPKTVIAKIRADAFKVEVSKGDLGEEIPHLLLPAELQDIVEVKKLTVR